MRTRDELEAMSIAEMEDEYGLERADLRPGSGSDGRVVKQDYVEAAFQIEKDQADGEKLLREAREEAEPFRGVSAHPNTAKRAGKNRFQVNCSGTYIGKSASAEDGARLYDQALLNLDLDPVAIVKRANFPDELPQEIREATEQAKQEEAVEA